jgi:hypothetical protein
MVGLIAVVATATGTWACADGVVAGAHARRESIEDINERKSKRWEIPIMAAL